MSKERFEYVSSVSREYLNHRQMVDYDSHLEDLISWQLERGKDPDRNKGLSSSTVSNYAHRQDKFYRWVWKNYEGYTTNVHPEHANEYIQSLAQDEICKENGQPYSECHKRKTANAIQKLFEWQARRRGGGTWEPSVTFYEKTYNHADAFTKAERLQLREATLEYDTIPAYNDLSPDERERWKCYLAQKLGKKKSSVSPDDWDKQNESWKIPSLVMASLDAGLRPIEINRATLDWLRLDKGVLYIPKEDAAKERDHWEPALTERTVKALKRWIPERKNYPKYDGNDWVWLTRKGNPYTSDTLNYLLDNLCEAADISQENRKISWYSIRHSTGTYMTDEGNLAETQEQLRHKSPQTTMKYANPPAGKRRETLNKI